MESCCHLAAENFSGLCGIRSAERRTSVETDIRGFVRRRFFVAPHLPAVGMAASVAPSNGRIPCRAGAKFEGDGIPAGMEKQRFLESINRLCARKPIFSPIVPNSYTIPPMAKSNLSAAKTASLRARCQRDKAESSGDKKSSNKGLGSEIHAAFRSSSVEFQIVTPPRRGKNRARPIPFVACYSQ